MVDLSEKPLRVIFGANVRRARSAKGYSQEAFADLVGVDRTYMGDIERGKRNVGINNIEKIARSLDVIVAELVCENKDDDGKSGAPGLAEA